MSERLNPAPSESTTPTGHERESRALEELEPIPAIASDADEEEINEALGSVKRNLRSRPMVHLKQIDARVRELEEKLRVADTDEGGLASDAVGSRVAATKLSEVLSEAEKTYPGGLGFYRHHVAEKAKLNRLMQGTHD